MIELIADITDGGKRVRVPLNVNDVDAKFEELLKALTTQAMYLIMSGELLTKEEATEMIRGHGLSEKANVHLYVRITK